MSVTPFQMSEHRKVAVAYLLPFVLLVTTGIAFYFLPLFLGQKNGYFAAFLFYWLFWCMAVPVMLTGKRSIIELFRFSKPLLGEHKFLNLLFLLLPLVLVYSYEFPKVIKHSNDAVILSSVILSVVNATAEEILWRGTFLKILGRNSGSYILFSSFGFAIWHFAPQLVFSNKEPGGAFSLVAIAFVLGLLYSYVAKDTRSILLTIAAHILFDFSGLGGRLYFS